MILRTQSSRTAQVGATLMELLATLAILAGLLRIMAPNVSQTLAIYTLHGAARQVFADLQKARTSAATENNRYAVSVLDAHTYRLHDDANNNGVIDAGESTTIVDVQTVWSGITVSAPGSLTFLPNGTVLASATITLTGRSGETKTVSVSQAGKIQVQ